MIISIYASLLEVNHFRRRKEWNFQNLLQINNWKDCISWLRSNLLDNFEFAKSLIKSKHLYYFSHSQIEGIIFSKLKSFIVKRRSHWQIVKIVYLNWRRMDYLIYSHHLVDLKDKKSRIKTDEAPREIRNVKCDGRCDSSQIISDQFTRLWCCSIIEDCILGYL